jgi:hypothetical protein
MTGREAEAIRAILRWDMVRCTPQEYPGVRRALLCFALLSDADEQPPVEGPAPTNTPSPLWTCPTCRGPMVIIERFEDLEEFRRSLAMLSDSGVEGVYKTRIVALMGSDPASSSHSAACDGLEGVAANQKAVLKAIVVQPLPSRLWQHVLSPGLQCASSGHLVKLLSLSPSALQPSSVVRVP